MKRTILINFNSIYYEEENDLFPSIFITYENNEEEYVIRGLVDVRDSSGCIKIRGDRLEETEYEEKIETDFENMSVKKVEICVNPFMSKRKEIKGNFKDGNICKVVVKLENGERTIYNLEGKYNNAKMIRLFKYTPGEGFKWSPKKII